ncbi:MAG: acetate--CoA ligase [Nitrospirae bacterium CG17_big_fil_post_rev_8_21_14_2_50_50_9]|nr:MAG: acetate--CoA ligase [Nitrospirae bacterium CG2_30_53_67]PIV82306.1 MAG: acetate--CoA ligase [Nitrospirae bacterium CG17_big_fil_post_rev_8_21_14_2_50_50_9]
MSDLPNQSKTIFSVPKEFAAGARVKMDDYKRMYHESIHNPEHFWGEAAKRIHWFHPWDKVRDTDFAEAKIAWFTGGKLNASYNCLDRHLSGARRDKVALIWEGNEPGRSRRITYAELHREVCRFANVLKKNGIRKGDRVTIYLPMVPELAAAMLACSRVGAIHNVIFGGFSPDSIRDRVNDSGSVMMITADAGYRGIKEIPLKQNVDQALDGSRQIKTCIVLNRSGRRSADMQPGRDLWWEDEMSSPDIADTCEPEEMDAEDPLFILYTSGSTGKPKGVMHTTGGFLVYTSFSHEMIFDLREDDVFWCTADIGWITGHSYIVYGPLCNGATSLIFEGVPNYPAWSRFWDVVDLHKVSIFYTAPTAIRAIIRQGEQHLKNNRLTSLRLLGTVGEPINPEAWLWYHDKVGKGKCPIVDTWWQTETGGILITPLPGAMPLKPGSACKPFFGVEPAILDQDGNELTGEASGLLAIKNDWPGIMRGVFGDPERFYKTYFSTYRGYYLTGDGARRDADGDYWITGRVDDVINVSGHRIGTAEVESALVLHSQVAEAAVVGYPHDIKGQGIYAYVTLKNGLKPSEKLKEELIRQVRKEIGPIAAPDIIHWAPGLPKTRSGKIMRRILRKIAGMDYDQLGDTTTLAEPEVIDVLIRDRKNMTS